MCTLSLPPVQSALTGAEPHGRGNRTLRIFAKRYSRQLNFAIPRLTPLGLKERVAIRTIRPSILPGEGGEIISLCGATPRMIIRLLRPLPEGAR